MLNEGGWGAWLALALGIFGAMVGAVGLLLGATKSRAALPVGVVTLLFSLGASLAGVLGTFWGRNAMMNALAHVAVKADVERITIGGWGEAAQASLLAFFAALIPLMMGGAAGVLGARVAPETTRRLGEPELVGQPTINAGRFVIVAVFEGFALLGLVAAWLVAHEPPPPTRYALAMEDAAAWDLVAAIDSIDAKEAQGCARLAEALDTYWAPEDRREWPRVMRQPMPAPITGLWRAPARACVEARLAADEDVAALRESSLLQDEDLLGKVQAYGAIPSLPPEAAGGAGLDKNAIATVVRTARQKVQRCYEKALQKQPTLAGKVVVEFTISPAGAVSEANADDETTMPDATVVRCVRETIEGLRFPKPDDGAPVTVKYPFVLSPAP